MYLEQERQLELGWGEPPGGRVDWVNRRLLQAKDALLGFHRAIEDAAPVREVPAGVGTSVVGAVGLVVRPARNGTLRKRWSYRVDSVIDEDEEGRRGRILGFEGGINERVDGDCGGRVRATTPVAGRRTESAPSGKRAARDWVQKMAAGEDGRKKRGKGGVEKRPAVGNGRWVRDEDDNAVVDPFSLASLD